VAYATAAERMLKAIGEPKMVDTRNDPRLSRIFANKVIKIYPAFAEFYGMEDAIEQVVSYFRHAAQGLEERKQILYLLGPVGGGKSSIAERLKTTDGAGAVLCDQGIARERVAARPVRHRPRMVHCSRRNTAFRRATCSAY
jgi:predicted Ser/Thr protein kinase